jgi:hypothetical protein
MEIQNIAQWGDYLIRLTSQTAHTSLARLTQVQRHLWALDAHEGMAFY